MPVTPHLLILLLTACSGDVNDTAPTSGSDSATDPGVTSPGVTMGDVNTCDNPAAAVSYAEVGEAWGLLTPLGPDERYGHQDGAGLAAADVNQDGQVDLLLTRMPGTNRQMLRDGDRFVDMNLLMPSGNGALWLDLDDDGRLDLLMGGPMAFRLQFNDQGGYEVVEFPAMDGEGVISSSVVHDLSPGDYDGDGRLEILLTRTADIHLGDNWHSDRLLHIEADGLEIEADAVPEDVGLRHGYDALTFDADGDGDLDAYVANDLAMNFGWSTLLRNDDGRLVDAADDCFCSLPVAAKGVDVADFDLDGQPDLYISGSPHNTLLKREALGGWVDVTAATEASHLATEATGWGGVFMDYDNDGLRDIMSAQGDRWNEGETDKAFDAPVVLLRQQGGVFAPVGPEVGVVGDGSFRSVIVLDFNDDGVEDIVVSQASDRPLFFLSQSCTDAAWIEVDAPIGAKVEVHAGGVVQTDWSTRDSGFIGTSIPRIHLGLGDTDLVDRIEVTLVGGDRLLAVGPFDARRRVVFPD